MFARLQPGAAGRLLLAGAVLATGVVLAAWGRSVSLFAWESTIVASRKSDELDRKREGLLDRLHKKHFLSLQVLEGRLGLLEAAAHFRALDQAPPAFHWAEFRDSFPGASEEERHCREVICHVDGVKTIHPNATAVVARLEQELRAHLRGGRPCLPEITTGFEYPEGEGWLRGRPPSASKVRRLPVPAR